MAGLIDGKILFMVTEAASNESGTAGGNQRKVNTVRATHNPRYTIGGRANVGQFGEGWQNEEDIRWYAAS